MTFTWKENLDTMFRAGEPSGTLDLHSSNFREKIDDSVAADVADRLRQSPATVLSMENHRIGPVGAQALAAALRYSNLEALNLASNPIGDVGVVALAEVLSQSAIRSLYITNCGLTNQGAQALIDALPHTNVTLISFMGGNDISTTLTGKLMDIIDDNKERGEIPRIQATPVPTPTPTTTVTAAENIERQRRAALEDGQGI